MFSILKHLKHTVLKDHAGFISTKHLNVPLKKGDRVTLLLIKDIHGVISTVVRTTKHEVLLFEEVSCLNIFAGRI